MRAAVVPSEGGSRHSWWGRLILVLGVIAVGLAFVLYRVATNRGTFVVEIDEAEAPTIEAKLKDGGIEITNKEDQWAWLIKSKQSSRAPSGTYGVQPIADLMLQATNHAGVELDTEEFRIKRGEKVIVRVTLAAATPTKTVVQPSATNSVVDKRPAVVKPNIEKPKTDPPNPESHAESIRQACEILLKAGIRIAVQEESVSGETKIQTIDQLPKVAFELRGITFDSNLAESDIDRLVVLLAQQKFLRVESAADASIANIDSCLRVLSRNKSLVSVEIFGQIITSAGLRHLREAARELRSIKVHGANLVDEDLQPFSQLTDLNIP